MIRLSDYVLSPLQERQFTLYRGHGDGLASILLVVPPGEYPSPSSLQRLEHEYALRAELDGDWAAQPIELLRREGPLMLVLADPGGESLERSLGCPMAITEFLRIAVPLAAAIGQTHARGLIHKDLKPANILVDLTSSSVWLTGFGIASRLPREHPAPAPPEIIAGTLAYMAPEQTGRMNRSVDSRSDLYALGIIFYEMLAGALPFTAADPMEWVHCHIARQPVPPDVRVAGIPGPLAAIVMKLLAKAAEDRYQTAEGIAADLRHCLEEWQATGGIAPFPLGAHDTSDRLLIPEKLYGREREIETLLVAFERVVAHGTPELVLVSGYSGIGKSSVVNELHKALVPPRGLFASGKFDQYKRDIPYATLAQAFRSLIRPLLGQSEAELGRWQDALREALGPNGQLMVDLVPELELVLGQQPAVRELPPQDVQNRFQMVFLRFLGVFARPEHPLALFLDDLQWLDTATLDLLGHLMTHSEMRHLILIGAYRDNEVGRTHPLLRTLEMIRHAGARVQQIVLTPLGCDDIGRLVADALHCVPADARPLAHLVHEKTGGNPFFAIQFFTALSEEGWLTLDPVTRAWQWDIDRIRAKGYTDNVVELMAGKLKRLSATTQLALKQLACLGNVAETATLALVQGDTEAAMHAALREAVHTGLVLREGGAYRFLHDRIQQAACLMIAKSQRAEIHLRIGRVLLAGMTADELAENLFDVANQFNRGAKLLADHDEKVQVATLNLRAGRRAKASAAYGSAGAYFAAGMVLLNETDWDQQYALTFSLWLERAECAFLTGEFHELERLLAELLQRGASKVDLAAVYHQEVLLHILQTENQKAIDSTLTCLRLFGIELPAQPSQQQVQAEYETVWRNLAGRAIEDLIDLPLMEDSELQAAMRLLAVLSDPAYVTDRNLFCLQQCRIVNLSMEHGVNGASAHACAYLGFTLGPAFQRYHEGFRFAKLGCDLVEKHGFLGYRAKVQDATGIAAFWTKPMETSIEFIQASIRSAIETGDLTYGCYGMFHFVTLMLIQNDSLDAIWRESERALDFVRKARFRDMEDTIVPQQRFIAAMQGRTATLSTFNDAQFDETAFEAQLTGSRMPTTICWYWIMKAKARFLSGAYAEALAAADKATALLWSSTAHFPLVDYYYYTALTIAALYDDASVDARQRWDELLALCEQLREWSDSCPPTFSDKHALVAAEIARIEHRDLDAMHLYEQAIRAAHDHDFVQNEGLAHEVAARFYAARGFKTLSNMSIRTAKYCYLRWGAEGKVKQLDRLHPYLAVAEEAGPMATIGSKVQHLDVVSVVKSSQAVSSEIVFPKLIEQLMTIALENAGAERGLLILSAADGYSIQAEAQGTRDRVAVALRQNSITASTCPESLVRYVIRTHERVILDDASKPNLFSENDYLRGRQIKSILCLPLIKQGTLSGLLYLENSLASHVFTPARISVLELLASQAAISLENARLYAELRLSEDRWRNLFESVPVGVVLTDSYGRYVSTNQAFQRMTGYTEAELCNLSPVDITHEDDRPATEAIIAARSAGVSSPQRIEKRYRRKDGTVVWVEASAFVAPVMMGAPVLAGVLVDITERRQAEEALRNAQADLARVARLTTLGELAASLAHEINQPLAGIVNSGGACLRWLNRDEPDLDSARDAASRVVRDAHRAGDVIRSLRTLAKKSGPQLARLNIHEAIEEVLALTRGELQQHDVVLHTDLSAGNRPVLGDRVQLQQVLLNLIVNGIQALATVTDRRRELTVSVGLAEQDRVQVTVVDTGPGLDPAIAPRIFDPFFTTKSDGLGMGLSICRSIIEAHEGRLWSSSRAPLGTAFHFTIPVALEA